MTKDKKQPGLPVVEVDQAFPLMTTDGVSRASTSTGTTGDQGQVPGHSLSPRELQIAQLVADGATNRAIASSLDISPWTVSTHMRRIFAKLDVCSRAEMVAQFFGGGEPGQR